MTLQPPPTRRPRGPAIVRIPDPDDAETFADAVREGLLARPKTLPCRYFYDDDGSRLFERICELPEYYLTRTEDAILRDRAGAMVAGLGGPLTMVELGSGSSSKTRRLIAAALGAYGALHYMPIDVAAPLLEESARALGQEFPALRVTGLAGDYRAALRVLEGKLQGPSLFVFLGSSLGNYDAVAARALLGQVAAAMGPADRLLLGTDLAKDRATLEAAYDDARGVTARFNRNILARINRELGGEFEPSRFAHEARWREDLQRVEMHLVSRAPQEVRVPGAGLVARFAAGESIHTENSHKYTLDVLGRLADGAGFVEDGAWADARGLFRVQRWRRRGA